MYNSNNYNNQTTNLNNSQNVYPSYSEIHSTPNYTLTSVSSMNDTSYQSSDYSNTPYNSKLNEFTIIYKMEIKKIKYIYLIKSLSKRIKINVIY